jgi:hypothetical protein
MRPRLERNLLKRPLLKRNLLKWNLLKRNLLVRNLLALCAFIAVEELREVFSLVGVDPDHDPGFPPWLCERIADVTHDRLPGRDRKSMQRAPLFPCRFQARSCTLSTCDQLWITHRATLP